MLVRTAIAAAAACAGAAVTGGKCADGAITAGMAHLFNFEGAARIAAQQAGVGLASSALAGPLTFLTVLFSPSELGDSSCSATARCNSTDDPDGRVGTYHRLGDTSDVIDQIIKSGELWGQPPRNTYASDIPRVKAYWGPLPAGSQGFEFTTLVDPDNGPVYNTSGVPLGQPGWTGPRPGVIVENGYAKIPVITTKGQGYQ